MSTQSISIKRYALVRGSSVKVDTIARYLPSNYEVVQEVTVSRYPGELDPTKSPVTAVLIQGEDGNGGWGLDSYVKPRLSSGLYGVEEIDLSHPVMETVPDTAPARRGGADFTPAGKEGPLAVVETAASPELDYEVDDQGTIVLIRPVSQAAKEWIEENIPEDAPWFGGRLAVEHRYAGDIICGLDEDGLIGGEA